MRLPVVVKTVKASAQRAKDARMPIQVKAICVLRRGTKILLMRGVDPATGSRFARPLGGCVEFGEQAIDTVVREIREELNAEVTAVTFRAVIESRFWYDQAAKHEIVFLFEASFTDPTFYDRNPILGRESNDKPIIAYWDDPRELSDTGIRVVPEGLLDLLVQS
jgi:ADP-ribose pyrophosphatase YjhB (NUDIX family)